MFIQNRQIRLTPKSLFRCAAAVVLIPVALLTLGGCASSSPRSVDSVVYNNSILPVSSYAKAVEEKRLREQEKMNANYGYPPGYDPQSDTHIPSTSFGHFPGPNINFSIGRGDGFSSSGPHWHSNGGIYQP